ncbi:sulfotransferase family protein [Crocosphaera sp.]|uniref:sulfotransferase family protein n=1 Tax=Crocosphaera sp. TaxID=2729996 RepID=UPI003F232D37|nr:sulfotransferase [Crocosphaera sp.]
MYNYNKAQESIFIVGVPRSGTTLLRVMLDSHPNLAVGPESPWIAGSYGNITSFKDLYYSLVEDKRGPVVNFSGLSEKDVALILGEAFAKILNSYAQAKGKKRWLEKTPDHITEIPFLIKLFPNSKYIHIVRDGRDVACSSHKEKKTWGKNLNLSNQQEKVRNSRLNALQRWCLWITQFEKWQQEYELNVCQIRYEDLVKEPRYILEKILSFINETWSDDVLNYGQKKHDIPSWEAGSRDVSQQSQITDKGVGQWKNKFTNTDKLITASFADHLLIKYGYPKTLIK